MPVILKMFYGGAMLGRKFILAMGIIVIACLFRALQFIDQATMSMMVMGIAGLYFTGNVIDKKINNG
jgi:hypothetical protein